MFRISLNMLTRQHLMVYGHDTMVSSDHLINSLTTTVPIRAPFYLFLKYLKEIFLFEDKLM